MLKGIADICLILGLLIGISPWASANHRVRIENTEVIVGNFCYDTPKYFEEVGKINKEQGVVAAKKRYWEIMGDVATPCYTGIQIPGRLGKMVSEVQNLIGNGNQCFHAQVWELLPLSDLPSPRKIYTSWHVECNALI